MIKTFRQGMTEIGEIFEKITESEKVIDLYDKNENFHESVEKFMTAMNELIIFARVEKL